MPSALRGESPGSPRISESERARRHNQAVPERPDCRASRRATSRSGTASSTQPTSLNRRRLCAVTSAKASRRSRALRRLRLGRRARTPSGTWRPALTAREPEPARSARQPPRPPSRARKRLQQGVTSGRSLGREWRQHGHQRARARPTSESSRSHGPGLDGRRRRTSETSAACSASVAPASSRASSARVVGPVRTRRKPGGTNRGRPAPGETPAYGLDSAGWRRASGIYLGQDRQHGDTRSLRKRHFLSINCHSDVTLNKSREPRLGARGPAVSASRTRATPRAERRAWRWPPARSRAWLTPAALSAARGSRPSGPFA